MREKIKLGDKVRDKITGLVGIAVAKTEFLNGCIQYKTEFLNGCIQYNVAPKVGKDNRIIDEIGIDIGSLEVIKPKKIKVKKKDIGGKNSIGIKQRGF